MKKALFLAVLLFAFGQQADAILQYSSTTSDSNVQVALVNSTDRYAMSFSSTTATTTLNISEIWIFEDPTAPCLGFRCDSFTIRIHETDGSGHPLGTVSGWSTHTVLKAEIPLFYPDVPLDSFSLTGPALVIGQKYHIVVDVGNPTSGGYRWRTDTSNPLPLNFSNAHLVFTGNWASENGADLMMIIDDGLPPPATPNVITNPLDLDIVTTQPFTVSGTCDGTQFSNMTVLVSHIATGIIMEPTPAQCISDTFSVELGTTLLDDDYTIALFPDDLGLALDTINITVLVPLNPIIAPPSFGDDVGCDTGELIADALCNVLTWLFIPNDIALANFGDLWDRVKNKPPIGFVTAGLVSWNTLTEGTSSEVLEGTSTLSVYFDPIKLLLTSAMWVLFLLWIIKRIGSMNI